MTDLRDRGMNGWSITQYIFIFRARLLKAALNPKSKIVQSMQVPKLLSNIALKFPTDLTVNFGCN